MTAESGVSPGVAQLDERLIFNQRDAGSTPVAGTNIRREGLLARGPSHSPSGDWVKRKYQ